MCAFFRYPKLCEMPKQPFLKILFLTRNVSIIFCDIPSMVHYKICARQLVNATYSSNHPDFFIDIKHSWILFLCIQFYDSRNVEKHRRVSCEFYWYSGTKVLFFYTFPHDLLKLLHLMDRVNFVLIPACTTKHIYSVIPPMPTLWFLVSLSLLSDAISFQCS